MAKHHDTGKTGEYAAAVFLEDRGWQILERNWRHGKLEVDIIGKDGEIIVLVEVKTRSSARHGEATEAVTPAKERRLVEAAEAYLEMNGLENEVRFDIITVITEGKAPLIRYYPGAFTAFS